MEGEEGIFRYVEQDLTHVSSLLEEDCTTWCTSRAACWAPSWQPSETPPRDCKPVSSTSSFRPGASLRPPPGWLDRGLGAFGCRSPSLLGSSRSRGGEGSIRDSLHGASRAAPLLGTPLGRGVPTANCGDRP